MKFHFSLEKILSLVKIKETMKRMEVASVAQRIEYLKRRRSSIEQNMRNTLELVNGGKSLEWTSFYTSKMELDVIEVKRIGTLVENERTVLAERQAELQ